MCKLLNHLVLFRCTPSMSRRKSGHREIRLVLRTMGKNVPLQGGSDGLIFDNLRFAGWYGWADVVDYLLYQPFLMVMEKGLKLCAFDVTTSKREEEEIEGEGDLDHDNDELLGIPDGYSFPDNDNLENYGWLHSKR